MPKAAGKDKEAKAPAASGGVKKKSGLQKPVKVTDELSKFLGGKEEVSRGDITKAFWAYFKANNLQDPEDKRYIKADDKLKKLLGEDRFLAFGIQKLIGQHIIKD